MAAAAVAGEGKGEGAAVVPVRDRIVGILRAGGLSDAEIERLFDLPALLDDGGAFTRVPDTALTATWLACVMALSPSGHTVDRVRAADAVARAQRLDLPSSRQLTAQLARSTKADR
jgi:hypothetical protein